MSKIMYVAFGDSLTSGVGTTKPSRSFSARYFQSIKRSPTCCYQNFGHPGMNSKELRDYMCMESVRNIWKRATHISITIGGNDLIRIYKNNGQMLQFLITIQRIRWNVHHILSNIQAHNPYAHVTLLGMYNPGRPSQPLYEQCTRLTQHVNAIYADLCHKHSAYFIDPYNTFLHCSHLLADEIHPNDDGHSLLSDLFIKTNETYMQHSE